DRLRQRKHERTLDVAEAWFSEELGGSPHSAPSPEVLRECSEEVSGALAAVFDRLGPDERSAFLLHDVFDYDYPELARMLGKPEPPCRQIVHRARKRLREAKPSSKAMVEPRQGILGSLLHAVRSGDRQAALSLIEAEVSFA